MTAVRKELKNLAPAAGTETLGIATRARARATFFACPVCKDLCGIHDTIERRWRRMDFFQYRCELAYSFLSKRATTVCHARRLCLSAGTVDR
jgi:hypothetical protein